MNKQWLSFRNDSPEQEADISAQFLIVEYGIH